MTGAATAATLDLPVPPIVKEVEVRRSPDETFRLFTREIASWWPLARVSAAPNAVACAFEEHVGGRVFERSADGTETSWGTVLAWEPPRFLAFSWTIAAESEDQAQRVEVAFVPAADGTRVRLTHSGWEKLGPRAATLRQAYEGGWGTVFEQCFAGYVEGRGSPPA